MSKRERALSECDVPQKRIRIHDVRSIDRFSRLSNELLLNIFSFLPVPSLNICQR